MDERERLLSELHRYMTIRERISMDWAVTLIEEMIRETDARLKNVPDQKALQQGQGEG